MKNKTMPETTTPQLSESEVQRMSASIEGNEPLRAYLARFDIDVGALIRDWKVMRASLEHHISIGNLMEAQIATTDRLHLETVAARIKADNENAALREQLAQASNERDTFKRQLRDLGYFAGSATGYTGILK